MFRIRRVYNDLLPANQEAIRQIKDILRAQFQQLPEQDIANLPEQLRNPLKYRFRSIPFVAEGSKGHVNGFALLGQEPTRCKPR